MAGAAQSSIGARATSVCAALAAACLGLSLEANWLRGETCFVSGANLRLATNSVIQDGTNRVALELSSGGERIVYNQAAIKQSPEAARLGPKPEVPHFVVRFALPIPPDNATNHPGSWTGLDEAVLAHNHSPGLEVLPNGDVLAVYFSARDSSGRSESDPTTRFIQARLRHGAEQWDPPELFLDFENRNDQSALLWQDGNTLRFFGGGREASPWMPFKLATSTDNGRTWTVALPLLDQPAQDYTAQPIANAFRGDGAIFFAMDAAKDGSFLWRSDDDGVHWHDTGGRTGARHSTVVTGAGKLLAIGGKNSSMEGWTPMNTSLDWGRTWSPSERSPFPALGGNQRPCLIRLASNRLLLVSDSYHRNLKKSPDGWMLGEGCFVALSGDDGKAWRFKKLPVALPHEKDHVHGTLGYATARQGPNGLIHVLTTMTQPCLHYEFNEAWVLSDAGEVAAETRGGEIKRFHESYADGSARVTWSARICPNGRYLLEGVETSYYSNGQKEHQASYVSGCKTGTETFWAPDGTKIWSWSHNAKSGSSVWTHYWGNGKKRVESQWKTRPEARELDRQFIGLMAEGPATQWNVAGKLIQTLEFKNGEAVRTPAQSQANN